MKSYEVLDGLFGRVERLELAIGDVNKLEEKELSSELASVEREVRRLVREGREYSDELMQLIQAYAVKDHSIQEDYLERLQTLLSSYETVAQVLRDLQKLDIVYEDLVQMESLEKVSPVQIYRIQELPKLLEACSGLLVRSLALAQRFIAWNVRSNEFLSGLDHKMKELEGKIDAM